MSYEKKTLTDIVKKKKQKSKKNEYVDAVISEASTEEPKAEINYRRVVPQYLFNSTNFKALVQRYREVYKSYYGVDLKESNLFDAIPQKSERKELYEQLKKLHDDIISIREKDMKKAEEFLDGFKEFKKEVSLDMIDPAKIKKLYQHLTQHTQNISIVAMISHLNQIKESLELDIEDIRIG